jgi:hypothetical protein
MVSYKDCTIQSKMKDRTYAVRTVDGGRTFEPLSVVAPDAPRSAMPSTVRGREGQLITAMRRRWDVDFEVADRSPNPAEFKSKRQHNWIDVYESRDDGRNWEFLSMVTITDPSGRWNGNPPAMTRLANGRICVAFGYRGKPYSIRAKISEDDGKSWGDDIILRDDATHWDLGYSRMVQRPDGKLVTIYYISTESMPVQHIEATIWEV